MMQWLRRVPTVLLERRTAQLLGLSWEMLMREAADSPETGLRGDWGPAWTYASLCC